MNEELREEPLGTDERPNSGLREGDISHAQVNAALRAHEKTIVFGQQNRLRAGVLLEDEKLPRFHAGHDLVKFFYGAVRQLPEYLLDALLHWGVSVTMVKSSDLLVFNHVRKHQTFHTGRTRKTIYMPELALKEASEKGYDYWASLVGSFYKVLAAGDGGAHDQALWWYMKQARREKRHVLEGLRLRGDEIPPAHRAIIQLLFKG